MAFVDSDPPSRSRAGWRRVLIAALLLNTLWLGRGVIDPGFRNLDVTGIVYNARLLLMGKLPYLDSAEVKPPGAFVLLAPALWLLGLRGIWLLGIVWGTLTSLAAARQLAGHDRVGRRMACGIKPRGEVVDLQNTHIFNQQSLNISSCRFDKEATMNSQGCSAF